MYDARRNNSWVVVVHLPTSQVDLIAEEIGFSILDEKEICLTLCWFRLVGLLLGKLATHSLLHLRTGASV